MPTHLDSFTINELVEVKNMHLTGQTGVRLKGHIIANRRHTLVPNAVDLNFDHIDTRPWLDLASLGTNIRSWEANGSPSLLTMHDDTSSLIDIA